MLEIDIADPCERPGLFEKAAMVTAGSRSNVIHPFEWASGKESMIERKLSAFLRGLGDAEVFTQVDAAHVFVFDHLFRRARHQHLSVV